MLNTMNRATLATGILGAAGGLVLYTGTLPIKIVSLVLNITTTATAGNRTFVLLSKNSGGGADWKAMNTTAQVASTTYSITAASGLPSQATTTTVIQVLMPLPATPYILPGCTLNVLDQSNIDVNDNVTIGAMVYEF